MGGQQPHQTTTKESGNYQPKSRTGKSEWERLNHPERDRVEVIKNQISKKEYKL